MKDSKITPKHPPELSVVEIVEQEAWEVKAIRLWQPGGVILDTYKVEDIIKTGGMGYIYIAEHQKWKVKMAIKSPNEYMLSDKSLFSRVLREADAWTELGLHPHIAYCYYVRKIEEIPYIFIEYVDGGNLRDWISDVRCYDLKIGLDIAIQICHGMEHAHNSGMIHRDIKPENILMTKEGMAKVTDFGIAGGARFETKSIGPDEEEKKEEVINGRRCNLTSLAGTYDYMSPEQYKDSHNVDERADIYSFGVCLYEMFCGKKPYGTAFGVAISALAKEEKNPPYEPIILRKDLPQELAMILKKCCELEREKRYNSFADLRELLVNAYKVLFHEDPIHAKVDVLELKADGLNNRGVSYLDLGRANDARRCWEEALKEDPQHLETSFNLGYLRWQKGEIPDDIYVNQMEGLKNNKGMDTDYWRYLAWIHFERGDIEAVEKIQQSEFRVEDEAFNKALVDKDRPIGKFLRTLDGHTGSITSVCFSPDGRFVLSGSKDKTIRLWDVKSGKELKLFEGHTEWVVSVSFSPSGLHVLSGSGLSGVPPDKNRKKDFTVRLWDLKSEKEIRRFEGHTGPLTSVCFSPDGRFVLSGSTDKTIRLWDVKSGKELKRFEHNVKFRTTKRYVCYPNSVCFSPDGHYVLSGGTDGTIRLWDMENDKEIRVFGPILENGFPRGGESVCFSPDGRYVLSDGITKLWDMESGKEIRQYGRTWGVCFSPDGCYVISDQLRLWEIENGRQIRRFEGDSYFRVTEGLVNQINSACFSPDGHYIVSGSSDGKIKLWEIYYLRKNWNEVHPYPLLNEVKIVKDLMVDSEKVKVLIKSAKDYISEKLFFKASNLLKKGQTVSGYERNKEMLKFLTICGIKGKGRRICLKDAWTHSVLKGHKTEVRTACFFPDGHYILSGGYDGIIMVWDVVSGSLMKQLKGHNEPINTVCFSSNGSHILSGGLDKTIRFWDVESGKEIRKFRVDLCVSSSVALSSEDQYVLMGGEDYFIRLWDLRSGKMMKEFGGHQGAVNDVIFSPNGHYAISASNDHTIRLWDLSHGEEIKQFIGHKDGVKSVSFSSDGRYAISGSYDKIIKLWDVESGKEVRRLEGHTQSVYSVCHSPDARFAFSGSEDNSVRLWNIANGREVWRSDVHTGSVKCVDFSSDGRYALSGSEDKAIRIWEFDWDWEF